MKHLYPDGADISRRMVMEFSVAVPDERAARAVAETVAAAGFDPSISHDDETDSWSVCCAKEMLATYEAVIDAQAELNRLMQPYRGRSS